MLARTKLLRLIRLSPLGQFFYICDNSTSNPDCVSSSLTPPCNCSQYYMSYQTNATASAGWRPVADSGWSDEFIANKTTLAGILNDQATPVYPTDSAARWSLASDVFAFYNDVLTENSTRLMYLRACLDTSLDEGVQYLEFRTAVNMSMYALDPATGQRQPMSLEQSIESILAFKSAYKAQRPELIDFAYALYEVRSKDEATVRASAEAAIATHRKYPDFIRGFDLVGEEVNT